MSVNVAMETIRIPVDRIRSGDTIYDTRNNPHMVTNVRLTKDKVKLKFDRKVTRELWQRDLLGHRVMITVSRP